MAPTPSVGEWGADRESGAAPVTPGSIAFDRSRTPQDDPRGGRPGASSRPTAPSRGRSDVGRGGPGVGRASRGFGAPPSQDEANGGLGGVGDLGAGRAACSASAFFNSRYALKKPRRASDS